MVSRIKIILKIMKIFLTLIALVVCLHSNAKATSNKENSSKAVAKEYLAGEFAARKGDFASAANQFAQALDKSGDDPLLLQSAYKFNLLAGQNDKAAEYAEKYLKYDAHDSGALMVLTVNAVKLGDFTKASALLANVKDSSKKHGGGAVEQLIIPFINMWVAAGEGNYDLALNMLDPKDTSKLVSGTFIALQRGLLLNMSGDLKAAQEEFSPLAAENAIMPYNLAKSLATFYESIGKWDEAENIYIKYSMQHPTTPHFEGADFKTAARQTAGLYIKTPKDGLAEVIKEAARLLFNNQLYNEGLFYLRLALFVKPADDEAKMLLANYYEQVDNNGQMIDIYNNISKESDFYTISQISLAESLYKIGKKSQAKKILLGLSDKMQAKFIPLVTLADLLRRDNEYKAAINAYSKVLENIDRKNVSSWSVFFARGMCYERYGEWKKAESDLQAALALNPNQPEVVNYLAYSWIVHNVNLEKARDMLLKAVIRKPDDPEIIDSAGWALYKLKDYDDAVRFLEKATELLPQDATINDHLGDAYWMKGRHYEARYQWQRAIKYGNREHSVELLNKKIANGLVD
jgi:tetratricopeptide (TPR) repeat protein